MNGIREFRNQEKWAFAPIHPLLRQRWSPRAFSARSVDPATLRALFEAARWAPSSYNAQPWTFILGTRDDSETIDRILSVLMQQNANWAKNAPVLVLAVAKNILPNGGLPNRYAWYDVGQAVAQMVTEAGAHGLAAHQMGGFDPEKAHEIFALPPDYEPVTVIALGYAGEVDALPEPLRNIERAPRQRKPLHEFVFAGRWGTIAPLVQTGGGGDAPFPDNDCSDHSFAENHIGTVAQQGHCDLNN